MTCMHCKFRESIGGHLVCTRHPPVASSPSTAAYFPNIYDSYSCGEYQELDPSRLEGADELVASVEDHALGGEISCCVDCVFCSQEQQPDGMVLECRRNSPLPAGYHDRIWPSVKPTDWCGDIKVYVEG